MRRRPSVLLACWLVLTLLGIACGRTTRRGPDGEEGGAFSDGGVEAGGGDTAVVASGGIGGASGESMAGEAGEPSSGAGGYAGESARCGDGETQAAEECDDGNTQDGDGCDADCTRSRVVQLATGETFSCALLDTGLLKCWGNNSSGATGSGSSDWIGDDPEEMGPHLPFVDLGRGARVAAISAGYRSTCALLIGGKVECWGWVAAGALGVPYLGASIGNAPGQMGDALRPVELGHSHQPKQLFSGYNHACAILDDDSTKCWGDNGFGELGLGDSDSRGNSAEEMGDALPITPWGPRVVTSVAAGGVHTCALFDFGQVKCVGMDAIVGIALGPHGDLGNEPTETGSNLPFVDLGSGSWVRALAAGYYHTCALLDDGSVKCWGLNENGELGLEDRELRGDTSDEMGDALPTVNLGSGRTAIAIAAGGNHTCAILDDHSLKCWGANSSGCLGIGDDESRGASPNTMGDALPVVELGTGRHAVSLSLGNDHTCAILDDDSVKCWGAAYPAALGYGARVTRGNKPGQMGDALPTVALW